MTWFRLRLGASTIMAGLSRPSTRRRLNGEFKIGLAGGKRLRNKAFPF
jgi:hypothetical protein